MTPNFDAKAALTANWAAFSDAQKNEIIQAMEEETAAGYTLDILQGILKAATELHIEVQPGVFGEIQAFMQKYCSILQKPKKLIELFTKAVQPVECKSV